ncbi:DUF995 domain-containing protein [Mesorhizobium sp. CCNWLW179-1]|uniref:DUF995 domain-containing protein n=1 Tax=unclassified Mesorhizobium TaxID=325217 RepID=UPI0030155009
MLTAATSVLLALIGGAYAATSQEVVLPVEARTMTAVEIHEVYKNKTWRWENGAGRMEDAGRQFNAWADGEKGKSWAEGRWVITNTGLMCLKATWHSRSGAFPAKACFAHMIHDGTVFQKRESDGGWYIFRHANPQKDDEASKLVAVDLVSERLAGVKAEVGSTQSSKQ